MAINKMDIDSIYQKYLGRAADSEGLRYFGEYESLLDVEYALFGSDEFGRNERIMQALSMPVAWKVCILEEAKLIFVPIAKNAHTSILNAFIEFNHVRFEPDAIDDELVRKHGSMDDKIHYFLSGQRTGLLLKDHAPAHVNEILASDEYVRVTVFRDPVKRMLSAYQHFFVQEVGNPLVIRHTRPVFEAMLGTDGDQWPRDPNEGLRRLVKFIMRTRNANLDPHWMPQSEYISRLRVDHVIPIERLDVLERLISVRSGRSFSIGHLNVRGDTGEKNKARCDDTLAKMIEEIYWLDKKLYESANIEVEKLDQQLDETARMTLKGRHGMSIVQG